ncbi:type II toxin-antitoxin system RelE family toxin [Planomonospora parontospora]|uniref:type II toxin-antitoxin system RelE family toxin n=1 Tax=Planomonospora parontospora TaxID=58119 RepID=UPI00166F7A5B|nr:hypothetical protein [Planomonospora parontospora]GGL04967.1 hypothetical protein GCM10014719_03960 [Planomonospora parontospora subsp. antibiotica]GII14383.1 hypothetical protein Ppa05_11090 [Planomonospora parontospora subsp. antibiotica]
MARYTVFLDHEAALAASAMPDRVLKEIVSVLGTLAEDPYPGSDMLDPEGPETERLVVGESVVMTLVINESAHEINILGVIWTG